MKRAFSLFVHMETPSLNEGSVACLRLTSSHPFHWIAGVCTAALDRTLPLSITAATPSSQLPSCLVSPPYTTGCNSLLTILPAATLAIFQPLIQSEARVFL